VYGRTLASIDDKQNAKNCYTGCVMRRTGCSVGRRRLTGPPHGGASGHAPSTPVNLVTNFSCEDLTSVSLGCEGLWKHITSFIISHYFYT
jgi:hypothetical protein